MTQIHELPYLNIQTTPLNNNDMFVLSNKTSPYNVYTLKTVDIMPEYNTIIDDVLDDYYTENIPSTVNPGGPTIHEILLSDITYPNYELDNEYNISFTLPPGSSGLLNVELANLTFESDHDYKIFFELFLTIEDPTNPLANIHSTIFFNFETYKHGKVDGSKINIFNRINDLSNTTLSIHDTGYFSKSVNTYFVNILHSEINSPYDIKPSVFLINDSETPEFTMFGSTPIIYLRTDLFGSIYNYDLELDINQNIYRYKLQGKIKTIKI